MIESGIYSQDGKNRIQGRVQAMTIRIRLVEESGEVREGDETLLEQWHAASSARLWLDVEGEIPPEIRSQLIALGCHKLAIGDIERLRQPPKVQEFDTSTFILFRGIISLDERLVLQPQQIGLFVGENYLVTIHRGKSMSIDRVWAETGNSPAPLVPRALALQIMDYASDRYLQKVLEFESHLADLEDNLLNQPSDSIMAELVSYRSELRKLRRIFNYHHRLLTQILGEEPRHLGTGQEEDGHLWRALLDRCERLFSLTSMYYEICGDLVEGYISISSHELNITMKILTIITAIFVPLSFLAGLYGMNFDNMPELHTRYGYFFALGAMAIIASLLVFIFKRKNWL